MPDGRSTAVSVADSAVGAAIGCGADEPRFRPRRLAGEAATGSATDVITLRPRRPAGEAATGSVTDVITFRPPRPDLILIRPADDQLLRWRRTLEGLQSQSRASAAALVSIRAFPTIHARASLSERARIGTMCVSDRAVTSAM